MATSIMPNHLQASNQDKKTAKQGSTLVIRNVTICGRRTSIRLEPEVWIALNEICRREFCTPHDVCSAVFERKNPRSSLTSAIRVMVLDYFRRAATEDGHYRAGHGQGMFISRQQQVEPSSRRENAQEQKIPGPDFKAPSMALKPAV